MTDFHPKRHAQWVLLAIVAVVAGATTGCVAGPEPAPKRVLLVTGEDYPGHRWQETAPVLRASIDEDPRLVVEVSEDLGVLRSERMDEFDVIVVHFKNYDPEVPGRPGFDNLARFVESGGGLVLVHFAGGAFQEFRKDYTRLAGRTWNPDLHGHDPHGPFEVTITDHAHPITRDMKSFETTDELYTCLDGATPITVLAEARSKVDDKLYPMAFVFDYGRGRVFHSPLGHDVAAFRTPGTAELFRRGTAWAARAD